MRNQEKPGARMRNPEKNGMRSRLIDNGGGGG